MSCHYFDLCLILNNNLQCYAKQQSQSLKSAKTTTNTTNLTFRLTHICLKVKRLKILGISGSPRKGGNTEFLISKALDETTRCGAEVEFLRIAEMKITPCDGCRTCRENGECRIKDDMHRVYKKMIEADGIIVGSPVYFWTVTGQMKIFMDRTLPLSYPEPKLKGKIAGAIVVAGSRGTTSALLCLNNFFLMQQMLPVGTGVLGYGRKMGDIKEDERAIRDAKILGKRISELIQLRRI